MKRITLILLILLSELLPIHASSTISTEVDTIATLKMFEATENGDVKTLQDVLATKKTHPNMYGLDENSHLFTFFIALKRRNYSTTNLLETVKILLDYNANPSLPITNYHLSNGLGIHEAARAATWNPLLPEIISKSKASLNIQNPAGETPLICAIRGHGRYDPGNPETVRIFLEHGADIRIKTNSNLTPLEVAQEEAKYHQEHLNIPIRFGCLDLAQKTKENNHTHAIAIVNLLQARSMRIEKINKTTIPYIISPLIDLIIEYDSNLSLIEEPK
jgi:ankyrin repeat protein